MSKKKRVLLISSAVIMVCLCIISGMTYALFTDSLWVRNHLKAGNLDVTLTRTYLEYTSLNADGELALTTNSAHQDFTESSSTETNIFGMDSSDIRIVPGSYFKADLLVNNKGNTAFDYKVRIHLVEGPTYLTNQLKLTFTRYDNNGNVIGTPETKMLSELAGGGAVFVSDGKIRVTEPSEKFSVKIEFIDRADNNEAQGSTAKFDLVVEATQATATASSGS